MKKTKDCNYETDTNQGPRTLINFDSKGWYPSKPCGGGCHQGVIYTTGSHPYHRVWNEASGIVGRHAHNLDNAHLTYPIFNTNEKWN